MKITNIALGIILILGLFLRVFDITNNPPGLYGDELTIALDANSLLKTGQDQLGNSLPLTFRMGAGRPPVYVYGSMPFVGIFGPSALGVRGLSVLSGLGIIILLYYISRKLFSQKIGLAAAFIAAVSIWDISLSRGGFEAHLALLLALLGFYLFLKGKEKPIFYIFSALSFGLTLHTYPTYKVSLLLFIPLLFWFTGTKSLFNISKGYFIGSLLIFLILGFVALSQTFIGGSEVRFNDINIFSKNDLKVSIEQKINLERTESNLPDSIVNYFHNKPVEYSKVFIENYLQNFSIDFLILHGDRNPRHNMATMGQIYAIEILLIGVGILSLVRSRIKILIFLLSWIALAPIATAVVDLPHALRSSFMLPPLILLSALGLGGILNLKNRMATAVIFVIFIAQFLFFTQKLYFLSPNLYGNFWSLEAKSASKMALENESKYDFIILSDRIDAIEFAYPVYAKVNPKEIIAQNLKKDTFFGFPSKKYENIYISSIADGEIQKAIDSTDGSVLFIGKGLVTVSKDK